MVWSNKIELGVKKDEEFKIKITASPEKRTVKPSEALSIKAEVTNLTDKTINIGREVCGVPGVIGWMSDNSSVLVRGGGLACLQNIFADRTISIKPKGIHSQKLTATFKSDMPSGPVEFKVGLEKVGYLPAWSAPIRVDIQR